MTTFKANEIQGFWAIEIDGDSFESDTDTAQQVLEMTIEKNDSFEVYQGRHMKLFIGEALGLGMVAAMKADNQMVYKSE